MLATIFSNELIIGTCDLHVGDASMGCLYGDLVAHENYKSIREQILTFNSSSSPDYKVWSTLRFNVQLETGYFLMAQGGFTFSDSDEFSDEPIRVDIAGVDLDLFRLPAGFFTGPWDTISVGSKIGLENELRKETEPHESFWKRLFDNEHRLAGANYSALARFAPADDVLFEISGVAENIRFAVVHLTWTHRREKWPHFPSVSYYHDLQEFAEARMNPDNEEYRYDE